MPPVAAAAAPPIVEQQQQHRKVYRSFWDKYSGRADNTSMLLNANADELEALDRAEIIGLLPEFDGKFVVDIGAGIGRFTTEFAQRARKVVSADFMENFINKNKERNAHFGNVEWRVGDAIGLEFEENSVDLLFTNWLLMYLSDEESVRFLCNVLRWLQPNGHLHLRESCSEPSTRKTSGGGTASLHNQNDVNPTRYRFSSTYIQLLHALRHWHGDWCWRFEIEWSCSVAVYIEKNANWRQIHWLVRKVPALHEPGNGIHRHIAMDDGLVNKFAKEWPEKQKHLDEALDARMATNKSLTEELALALEGLIAVESMVFAFNSRMGPADFGIDAQTMANHFDCRVWLVERDPYCYRHALTAANRARDRRVRLGWHPSMHGAIAFWTSMDKARKQQQRGVDEVKKEAIVVGEEEEEEEEVLAAAVPPSSSPAMFDAILGIGLLQHIREESDVAGMADLLKDGGRLASLETMVGDEDTEKMRLLQTHFTIEQRICMEFGADDGANANDGIVVPMMKLLLLVLVRSSGKEETTVWEPLPPINTGF